MTFKFILQYFKLIYLGIKEDNHICATCMAAFDKPYILMYHLQTHIKQFPYICHICQSGYSRGEQLSNHCKKEHPNYRNCRRCWQSFPEDKFPDHVCIEKRPYVCQNCGSGFGRLSSLNDHSKSCNDYSCCSTSLREYHYEFKGSYNCRTCKVNFSHLGQLIKHKVKNHRSFAPSNGSRCTDVHSKGKYVYYNIEKSRRRSILPFSTTYSCRFCKKAFQFDKELQEHLSSKHPFRMVSGHYPYKCSTCGAYCVTEKHLTKHKTICVSKKRQRPKTMCSRCGLILNRSSLTRHMKVHAKREAEHASLSPQEKHGSDSVDTVDGTSSAAESLQTSAPAETQNDNVHGQMYKCGHCDAKYPTLDEISSHSRACHTNKANMAIIQKQPRKTKECRMCHLSFLDVSNFRSHMQDVHDYKECMFCQRVFSTHSTRSRHIKKFHSDNSESKGSTKRARVEPAGSDEGQPISIPDTYSDANSELESSLSTSQSGSDVQPSTQMMDKVAPELTNNHLVGVTTKTSSTDKRVFECDQCGKVYKYYIFLVKHFTKHHPEALNSL